MSEVVNGVGGLVFQVKLSGTVKVKLFSLSKDHLVHKRHSDSNDGRYMFFPCLYWNILSYINPGPHEESEILESLCGSNELKKLLEDNLKVPPNWKFSGNFCLILIGWTPSEFMMESSYEQLELEKVKKERVFDPFSLVGHTTDGVLFLYSLMRGGSAWSKLLTKGKDVFNKSNCRNRQFS